MAINILKQTMIDILRDVEKEAQKSYRHDKPFLYVKMFGDDIEEWGHCPEWNKMARWQYRFPDVIGLPDEEKLARTQHWLETSKDAPPIKLVDWI